MLKGKIEILFCFVSIYFKNNLYCSCSHSIIFFFFLLNCSCLVIEELVIWTIKKQFMEQLFLFQTHFFKGCLELCCYFSSELFKYILWIIPPQKQAQRILFVFFECVLSWKYSFPLSWLMPLLSGFAETFSSAVFMTVISAFVSSQNADSYLNAALLRAVL